MKARRDGFNPCFNGYSTLTKDKVSEEYKFTGSFNPCFNGYSTLTSCEKLDELYVNQVSILVLMDTLL